MRNPALRQVIDASDHPEQCIGLRGFGQDTQSAVGAPPRQVRIASEEYNRNAISTEEDARAVETAAPTCERDVHERQVGPAALHGPESVRRTRERTDDAMPMKAQERLGRQREQFIVFDQHDLHAILRRFICHHSTQATDAAERCFQALTKSPNARNGEKG